MIKNLKQKIKNKFSYSLLKDDNGEIDYFNEPCPENDASLWSRLTFNWTQRMLMSGYFNGPLEMKDICDLPDRIKVDNTTQYLYDIDYNPRYKWPLIVHIYKEYVARNKGAITIKILSAVLSIVSPITLKYFIEYIKKPIEERSLSFGLLFSFLLFLSSFLFTYSQQYGYWFGMKISLDVRGALTAKIFEKTLKLSNAAKRSYNSGAILNMISVDVGCFSDFYWNNMIEIFVFPFQILALLALLCYIVGLSGFVGFGVMVISLPLCTYLSTKISKNLRISLGYADTRCNLTSEFINGIRFLKLYAWEQIFLDRIEEQRKLQLKYLYKRAIYWILDKMITQVTSALVLVSTFSVYVLVGNTLSAEVAFTAMTIFVNLRRPLDMFPESIHRFLSLIPSSKRIEDFFQASEIQDQPFKIKNNNNNSTSINNNGNSQLDIKINNATFDWNEIDKSMDVGEQIDENRGKSGILLSTEDDDGFEVINGTSCCNDDHMVELSLDEAQSNASGGTDNYVLKNVNFVAPGGKLTVICGVVGSGKTSLINGLIGEIYRVNGSVDMPSKISFTTQQPFLLSTSLRDNILFGNEMNMDRYKKVIEACCLTPDLLQLSGKDLTEIGERGINLSGGQKQRISLARALYADSDCYILDEPLSAVDPLVAVHLFDHCIQGMMSNKTRILVTHQIQFIPSADHIVVVDKGQLTQGTYSELKAKGIDFESIMKTKKLNIEEDEKKPATLPLSPSETALNKSQSLLAAAKELDINTIISDKHDPDLVEKAKLMVKEDRNEGEVGLEVYRQYFRYGSSSFFFLVTCLTYFLSQVLFQGSDFFLVSWLDNDYQQTNAFYIGYYCLLIALFIAFLVIRYFMMAHITFSASKNLHSSLLNSVGFAGCSFFDTNPSGRILNRFSKDINDIDLSLLECFSDVLYCGFTVIIAIGAMTFITPLISIPFAFLVAVYFLIQKLYRASSRELKRMESITRSPVFSLLAEAYNGLVTIRTYQQQKRFIDIMYNNININLRLFFYSFSVHRWVGTRLELMSASAVFLAAIFSLFSEKTSLSVLCITTALSMTSYLNWTIRQLTELEVRMNSVERVESYINTPSEGIRYTEDFEDNEIDIDQDDNAIEMNVETKWPVKGEIEFKNVEIKYRPTADPSLRNISFKVNENEKIGVVGRTGAGKSTIGVSLFRMVECSKGAIFIDGVDISKIGLHKLRSSLGIVPQDPFIFSGTIRMNIDPFKKYSDDQIWEALEKVKLKDQISLMPMKLETEVQENGDGLSFGQKQLLCLCRTILKSSKVILQDESTSGIDYATASLLKTVCDNEFKNCTMLTIAHRLDTIIDSDKIAVVDKGQLVEYDSPMNLIRTDGSRFKKMVHYQTNFYEESSKKF